MAKTRYWYTIMSPRGGLWLDGWAFGATEEECARAAFEYELQQHPATLQQRPLHVCLQSVPDYGKELEEPTRYSLVVLEADGSATVHFPPYSTLASGDWVAEIVDRDGKLAVEPNHFDRFADANRWAIDNASTEDGNITLVRRDNVVHAAYVGLAGIKSGRVAPVDECCGCSRSELPSYARKTYEWFADNRERMAS